MKNQNAYTPNINRYENERVWQCF